MHRGWLPDLPYFCPIPLVGTNSFEGQDLTPDGTPGQVFGPFVSSNAEVP